MLDSPSVVEVLHERYRNDPVVAARLATACRAYRKVFPIKEGICEIKAWLKHEAKESRDWGIDLWDGHNQVFSWMQVTPKGPFPFKWYIEATFGVARTGRSVSTGMQGSHVYRWFLETTFGPACVGRTYFPDIVIAVGREKASMSLVSKSTCRYQDDKAPIHLFTDTFKGIRDLDSLIGCIWNHTVLCYGFPENTWRLPACIAHRHRDSLPWSRKRAFFCWRAALKARRGYESWSERGRGWKDREESLQLLEGIQPPCQMQPRYGAIDGMNRWSKARWFYEMQLMPHMTFSAQRD